VVDLVNGTACPYSILCGHYLEGESYSICSVCNDT
jgi:hypothetical protein